MTALVLPRPLRLQELAAGFIHGIGGTCLQKIATGFSGSAIAANCQFTDHEVSSSNTDVYTFSALSLGAEHPGRHIIMVGASRSAVANSLSSSSIGGVSATELVDFANGASNVFGSIAHVPTGTTGDVVITHATGAARAAVAVYRVVGLRSTTQDASGPDTDATDPLAGSLNVTAGGFAIGVIFSSGAPTAPTWTGITEDVTVLAAAWEANGNISVAHQNFSAAQSGLTVQGDWGGTPSIPAGAFISMR